MHFTPTTASGATRVPGLFPAAVDSDAAKESSQVVAADLGGGDAPPPLGVCLADVEAAPIRWMWPSWLALGKVHVFDGNPGMGKSTLLSAIAASVTAGVRWPDGSPVPTDARGGVVVLTAEDDPATTIRPRMEAADADVARVSVVATVPTTNGHGRIPTFPDDVPLMLRECQRVGARLLVVDPVTAYLGGGDSHKDGAVRGMLAPLAAAAEGAGVAVILVRHLNKAVGGSAMMRGGGSIAFAGLARVVWLVGTDPAQPTRRALAVSKNNLAPIPPTLGYDLESAGPLNVGRVVWTGTLPLVADDLVRPPAAPRAATPAQDAAEAWLETALADGWRPACDLYNEAGAEGISKRTLQRAKDRLGVAAEKRDGFDGGWSWGFPLAATSTKDAKTPTAGVLRDVGGDGAAGISQDDPENAKDATPLASFGDVASFEERQPGGE